MLLASVMYVMMVPSGAHRCGRRCGPTIGDTLRSKAAGKHPAVSFLLDHVGQEGGYGAST